jgi:hypothetical protein
MTHIPRSDPRRLNLERLEERSLPSVTLGTGIDGTNVTQSALVEVPPDTIAAVGPSHVMELVNNAVAIYTKAGSLVSRQSFATFFAPIKGSFTDRDLFDPEVRYDDIAGRWLVGVDEQNGSAKTSNYLLAVSNDSDPTHGFTEMHVIPLKEGNRFNATWGDYPHLGYNADAYVLTANQFTFTSGQFKNIQMVAIAKSSVLDANNSTFTSFKTDIAYNNVNFTLHPAVQHGAGTGDPIWAVEENGYQNGSSIRIDRITNVLSNNPTITSFNVTVPAYSGPPSAASAGGVSMDAGDARIQSAALRGGRLVVSQTVGLNGVATARVYEFNVSGTPGLTQTINVVGPGGAATYYPAADLNAAGTIGFSYMESSSTERVSTYVGGQVVGSAAGSYQSALAQAGLATYSSFETSSAKRAGDYGGIGVDPVDDSFWGANEYTAGVSVSSTNWGTHIRNFTISGITGPTQGSPTSGQPKGGGGSKGNVPIFERELPVLIYGDTEHGNSGGGGAPAGTNSPPLVPASSGKDVPLPDLSPTDHAFRDAWFTRLPQSVSVSLDNGDWEKLFALENAF